MNRGHKALQHLRTHACTIASPAPGTHHVIKQSSTCTQTRSHMQQSDAKAQEAAARGWVLQGRGGSAHALATLAAMTKVTSCYK